MRIGSSVVVAFINAFLAGFFLAQYLSRAGGADRAPTTWLALTAAFSTLALWRLRMILRALKRVGA
jgi:hypothetical protein